MYQIFKEIDLFDTWAKSISDIPQENRYGEWECNYDNWTNIYIAFEDFLQKTEPQKWNRKEIEKLLYIIARDNEMESLAEIVSEHEDALIILTKNSIIIGESDTKWQLCIQLNKLRNKDLAISLLEQFIEDDEEYVNRRALMELAKTNSKNIERYCKLFWDRNKYQDDTEYQRIAVLHSLYTTKSPMLKEYLKLAKEDGRKYLVDNANRIESLQITEHQ